MASRFTFFPRGVKTYPRDHLAVIKKNNFTVTASQCKGRAMIMEATSTKTFTLPALTTVVGAIVTLVNNSPNGSNLVVDPNAADGIAYGDDVTNGGHITNSSMRPGDYVTLIAVGAVATGIAENWTVAAIQGTWS